MAWIFVIIAGLILGALLIGSQAARMALIGGAVVIGLGAGWLIYREYARNVDARTLITPEQVELRAAQVEKRGGLYYLVTAAKNLSEDHAIASLRIRVQALDCPTATASDDCEIVGDRTLSMNLLIPAQQVRAIEELAPFADLAQVEHMLWAIDVVEVRAEVR